MCTPPTPLTQPPPTQWVLYRQVLQMVMKLLFFLLVASFTVFQFERIIPASLRGLILPLQRLRCASVTLKRFKKALEPPLCNLVWQVLVGGDFSLGGKASSAPLKLSTTGVGCWAAPPPPPAPFQGAPSCFLLPHCTQLLCSSGPAASSKTSNNCFRPHVPASGAASMQHS